MKAVAIIPAKGTSGRIPDKNKRMFHGKPMLAYPIETARESGLFQRIVVSTEDAEIAKLAKQYKAEVVDRPPELAEIGVEDCGTQEVTRHALLEIGVTDGYTCCIYPCTPMLDAFDLHQAFAKLKRGRRTFVYVPGWFYMGKAEWFIERKELSPWHSIKNSRAIDINTPEEWMNAEWMYARLTQEKQILQCDHKYELYGAEKVPHPDMIHFRCPKCGATLPT